MLSRERKTAVARCWELGWGQFDLCQIERKNQSKKTEKDGDPTPSRIEFEAHS